MALSDRPAVVLVLVEPSGPRNVGSVARLCANFGIAELRLVAPRCDPSSDEARQMAVHGGWVLEQARHFPNLAGALADCRRVVACSGRGCGEPLAPLSPEAAVRWLLATDPSPGAEAAPRALVFGREDRGLSRAELLQAGQLLQIETAGSYSSLNLSHAAAVVLHGLQQGRQIPAPPQVPPTQADPCSRGDLEALLGDAEALLLAAGFLLPHTATARLAKVRGLLQRAQVSSNEVALLRGMVRQLRWAQGSVLAQPMEPPSVGGSDSADR